VGGEGNHPNEALGRGIWAGDAVWRPARDAILQVKWDSQSNLLVTSALPLPERKTPYGNLLWHAEKLYLAAEDCLIAWDAPPELDPPKKPLGAAK
jgi:hypothetical protein